jgi:hypothetical protein
MGPWGLIGQSHITFGVTQKSPVQSRFDEQLDIYGKMLCKAVTFLREPFRVNHVEPGALPLSANFFHRDAVTGKTMHTVAAYRCTQCRTLFIVPRVEDLRHACTEEFEPQGE